MLGVDRVRHGRPRRPAAAASSASSSASATPTSKTRVGVFFGEPGQDGARPLLRRRGTRPRPGCMRCGRCMVGCPHGAKNTLVKNYLWLAEKRGVEIQPERQVTEMRPLGRRRRLRRLRGHQRALRLLGRGSAHGADRARRGRRRRPARHQPAAAALPPRRRAAADLGPARRAGAHQQRVDPRRHRPERLPRTSPSRSRSPPASTPTPTPTSRPSPTARRRLDELPLHAADRRRDRS